MTVLLEVRTQARAELTSGQLQISGCSSSQFSSGDNTAQDTRTTMVVMLKQCCCGCSLKMGSLIIAVTFAILNGLLLLTSCISTYNASYDLEHFHDLEPGPITADSAAKIRFVKGFILFKAIIQEVIIFASWRSILAMLGVAVIMSLLGIAQLVLDLLLIFGINKDDPKLVLPWVVFYMPMSIIDVLVILGFSVALFIHHEYAGGICLFILTTAFGSMSAYFMLVVYSYYRELRSSSVARRIS